MFKSNHYVYTCNVTHVRRGGYEPLPILVNFGCLSEYSVKNRVSQVMFWMTCLFNNFNSFASVDIGVAPPPSSHPPTHTHTHFSQR